MALDITVTEDPTYKSLTYQLYDDDLLLAGRKITFGDYVTWTTSEASFFRRLTRAVAHTQIRLAAAEAEAEKNPTIAALALPVYRADLQAQIRQLALFLFGPKVFDYAPPHPF